LLSFGNHSKDISFPPVMIESYVWENEIILFIS